MSPHHDRVAALLLLLLSSLTLATGAYFLFIRPAMLPEDVRLTGMQPGLLPPAMLSWLELVFRTLGGFIVAFGILLGAVAGYLITSRPALLSWGVAVAVVVAFSRFLASNMAIHSDFLWYVAVLFAIASAIALRIAWSRGPRAR